LTKYLEMILAQKSVLVPDAARELFKAELAALGIAV
jgi:hypothetical protein